MSTLELYIWENRVIEVVMFIVKNMQIGIKLAGIIFSDNLIIETTEGDGHLNLVLHSPKRLWY